MRTRKFLLTSALIVAALFSVNSVNAQVEYSGNRVSSDAVTVNLKFKPIQSIQINPAQNTVDFVYDTPEEYTNGLDGADKTLTKNDHLTVYHSGPFDVKVTSTGFTDGSNALTGDHVTVKASKGASMTRDNFTYSDPVSLAAVTGASLIESTGGGMGLTFDITYDHTGFANGDYINKDFDSAEKVYSATVTYTIQSR